MPPVWLLHGRLFDRPCVTDALGLPVASEDSSWFPEFLETEGLILSSSVAGPVTGSGPIRPPHATGRRPAVLTYHARYRAQLWSVVSPQAGLPGAQTGPQ